jgi:AcrR family transcriptional regulator
MTLMDEIAGKSRIERPRQRARTRARIERAARKIFLDGDYLGCSVKDIVDTAGLSRAVFYLHFRDKGDLLASLIRHSLKVQHRTLTRGGLPRTPSDDDLRRWVRRAIDGIVRSTDNLRLIHLGSFVDPAVGPMIYGLQNDTVLDLAQRNPVFAVLDDAGDVRTRRFAEFSLLIYELGQVAVAIAYATWPAQESLAVDLIVARLRRFIEDGQAGAC